MTETTSSAWTRPGALVSWLALAFLLGLLGTLSWCSQQPPAVRSGTAREDQFGTARAMQTIRTLADDIGQRPIGSPEAARAAQYLFDELKRVPRVEVEFQDARTTTRIDSWLPDVAMIQRVRNVVARLPGQRSDAILLSAHYDSGPDSVGGADDGIGVAVALETIRALAAGPPLERSIVICLNGGEEVGQAGSRAFVGHRWFKDVKAWLDFEGSRSGKAALLIASSAHPDLIDAFAREAKAPLASVLFDDLSRSSLLVIAGDFMQYTAAGKPGLDLAGVGDMASAHTLLDRAAHIDQRTVQHMGDSSLAIARDLANSARDFAAADHTTVYYDLFGLTVIHYSTLTARFAALFALALLGLPLVVLVRRRELTSRRLASGLGWHLMALSAGLLGAMLSAALLALVLRHPHGWFSLPFLIAPTFGGAGLCGVLAIHLWWRQHLLKLGLDADQSMLAVWASGALFWAILLLLGSVMFSAGVTYLALWWVLPTALALIVATWLPRWRWWAWLVSAGLGLLFFVQLTTMFIPTMAAMSGGSIGVPVPQDMTMAAGFWLFAIVPIATGALAAPHGAGKIGRALAAVGAVALIGLIATALRSPYSADRPKPLIATHAERNGEAVLLLASLDFPSIAPVLPSISQATPVPPGAAWPNAYLPGRPPDYSHQLPAPRLTTEPPRIEIASTAVDMDGASRSVTFRLLGTGWMNAIEIPAERLLGWSLGDPLPRPLPANKSVYAVFFALDPSGEEITLRFKGREPVELVLMQTDAPGKTKELLDLQKQLPDWTSVKAFAMHVVKVAI